MRKLNLNFLLRHELEAFNNDNLHRIAISNLDDGERRVARWWTKKYQRPLKRFSDHTLEELVIEQLEDFYAMKPQEVAKFEMATQAQDDWEGEMPPDHERAMKKRFGKKQIDLTKWQDQKELTEEEEKQIIANLGMKLPGSKRVVTLGDGEIEDDFASLGEG